ncbi:MAG: hypothetical protein FWH50_02140, partial [Coriobacteriia bacterium]|nr:hypothetical protein [Coriobacteriia bacterium]
DLATALAAAEAVLADEGADAESAAAAAAAVTDAILALVSEGPAGYAAALAEATAFIRAMTPSPTVDSVGGEWAVIALARSGYVDEAWYGSYLDNLEAFLSDPGNIEYFDPDTGAVRIHWAKITENERVILALTALGQDASGFRGFDLVAPLADTNAGGGYVLDRQGINGVIFALIALDSGGYMDGAGGEALRQWCIDYLLDDQCPGGGWSLMGGAASANADITGMALQSLAPYYRDPSSYRHDEVAAAADAAIAALQGMQSATGGFNYNADGEAVESAVQVLVALCALGTDGTADGSFIQSVLDNVLSFKDDATGGFRHVRSGGVDGMASEQAAYALVAYDRHARGLSSLYDMADGFEPKPAVSRAALAEAIAAAEALAEADYTPASWAALQSALAQARDTLAEAAASQAAVDAAVSALNAAVGALAAADPGTGTPAADKAALASAVTAAEAAVAGKTAGDYTAASWTAFQTALTTARSALAAADSVQADVDAAAAALLAATAALEPAQVIVNPPTEYGVLTGFADFTGSGSRFAVINADQATFVSLTLGGATINPANYAVSGGSTVVTLFESYLKTLPNGTYTFRANFTDGYADLVLRVDASGTGLGGGSGAGAGSGGGPGSGPGGGTGPGGGPGSGPGGGSSPGPGANPGALPKTGEDYSLHLLALAFMVAGSVMLLCDWDIRRRRAAEIYFAQHLK